MRSLAENEHPRSEGREGKSCSRTEGSVSGGHFCRNTGQQHEAPESCGPKFRQRRVIIFIFLTLGSGTCAEEAH